MTRPANPKYCFPAAPVRAEYRIADRNKMKVIGLAGWSGAGKTTLLSRAIPYLRQQGLRVSVIKHAHHDFDVDVPGKDSWVHRQSGAEEVLVTSANRWALMHELRGEDEPTLDEILSRLAPCDIVLVEGYKRELHRKIETRRLEAKDRTPLSAGDPNIVAVAADFAVTDESLSVFDLDDAKSIVDFIERMTGLVA